MRILISGASISGPVLAYWLKRYGHTITVVERAPALRKTGGHSVDLYGPALEISEKMGVLDRIQSMITGSERMIAYRQGIRRPASVDLTKVFQAASDRHVEIMRDDLSQIYYDATQDHVEYIFGDSITAISPSGEVTFEHGQSRRFDIVVGADGLHSNTRRLVFGEEPRYTTFLGAYLAVISVPKDIVPNNEFVVHLHPNRLAGVYTARHLSDARSVFMFRSQHELDYRHRDVPRQKALLREAFQGMHADVDRCLALLEGTPSFYFDSITQLHLETWSQGRGTLVGDAAYCPGPAVGGSTSLAVIGAYVLAGELAAANGDYIRAFAAYEREMAELVQNSRALARGVAKSLIPRSRLGAWALVQGARLISILPAGLSRALARLDSKGIRHYDSFVVKDYPAPHSVAAS